MTPAPAVPAPPPEAVAAPQRNVLELAFQAVSDREAEALSAAISVSGDVSGIDLEGNDICAQQACCIYE